MFLFWFEFDLLGGFVTLGHRYITSPLFCVASMCTVPEVPALYDGIYTSFVPDVERVHKLSLCLSCGHWRTHRWTTIQEWIAKKDREKDFRTKQTAGKTVGHGPREREGEWEREKEVRFQTI